MRKYLFALVIALAPACQSEHSKLDELKNKPTHIGIGIGSAATASPAAELQQIDSTDILSRTTAADEADVKWVLFAWKELDATTYQHQISPRAKNRSNADAAKLALDTLAKLKADPTQIDALITAQSDQPNATTDSVAMTKTMGVPPEFKPLIDLSLRLNEGEAGVVRTPLGYHVVVRVKPAPADPLESSDILQRAGTDGVVRVEHVLVGWKDTPAAKRGQMDPRAKDRTKADADKLASEVLAKARAGEDFKALMKQYSEDPGSKDTGEPYEVTADAALVPSFKKLSLRLKVDESGLVESPFGWHIIKHVAFDPLESADVLGRAAATKSAKVKHILLGWADIGKDSKDAKRDPRAAARSRADLEKLVKDTVAKLQGGAKFEDVMKDLSEDPGSAKTGKDYTVTPDAQLVDPFKDLSLRLNVGEIGVVRSQFGMHIIKRFE